MESVFVSSTFRDMHKERDILNLEILPKLNHILGKEGKSIQFSDLRWGIDTTGQAEADAMKKIIEVCDNEIQRCKPYIIVLLGDRYGTSITSDFGLNNDKDIVGKSLTHIEVQKGVFQNIERDRIFIYFRETDYEGFPSEKVSFYKDSDEEDIKKLNGLKKQLIEEYGDRIKKYHAKWDGRAGDIQLEDFERVVYEDLRNYIETNIINDSISASERQYRINENLADNYTCGIKIPENKISEAIHSVNRSDENTVVFGECGCGKTAFLSKLYKEYKERYEAIIFFFGQNSYSSSVRGFVECFYSQLLRISGSAEWNTEYNDITYEELIRRIALLQNQLKQDVFVFVDAPANCDNPRRLFCFINWIRFFFLDKVHFILTSDDKDFVDTMMGRTCNILEITYDQKEINEMIHYVLLKSKKVLNIELVSLISQYYSNPLAIQVLITRLVNLKENDYVQIDKTGGGIEGINLYLGKLIKEAPNSTSELLKSIIDALFDDNEKKQILCIMKYLAISDRGVRECDLKGLVEKNGISWSNIVYASMLAKLGYAFMSNGEGVLCYAHYAFKEAFYPEDNVDAYIDLMELYSKASEEDFWAVEEFFEYAFFCEDQELTMRFIIDKCICEEGQSSKQICRSIAARAVEKANENGKGRFLFSLIEACKDRDQQFHYAELIKHSLIQTRNIRRHQLVVDNISLFLSVINEIDGYPQMLLRADSAECKRYLQRNNCYDLIPQVEGFFSERITDIDGEMLDEKREEGSVSLFELCLLLSMSKELGANRQYYESENIVKQLIERADCISERTLEYYVFLGDCYKELGNSLKCQQKWDEAVAYDLLYLELYENQLKDETSDLVKERYRVGLYNIANVYESKALATGDRATWMKTRELFERSYAAESVAIAFDNSDQGFLDAFSSIFSYAMSLLQTGDVEESNKVFFNAIRFIKRNASTNESSYLYATIVMYELDYLLQSILVSGKDDVRMISSDIIGYIHTLPKDDHSCIAQLLQAWKMFDSKISIELGKLFNNGEVIKASIICSEHVFIANSIHEMFNDPKFFVQLVIICKNWADINYNALKNYVVSERACRELISIIRENNLVVLFAKLGMGEQLADYICTATARIINSLVFQGKNGEAIDYLKDNYVHISSLAPITNNYQKVPAFLVYSLARNIELVEAQKICANFAIDIAMKSSEELENNKKIIQMCSELI